MQVMTVGEFKSRFSAVLEQVKRGKEVVISFGKKREKLAVLVPYQQYRTQRKRKLGLLEKKAKCVIKPDFDITDEEFLKA